MTVTDLMSAIIEEMRKRPYIVRHEILEQSVHLLKARLYISLETFVQIYRNDGFDTTNFVLIHQSRRMYARDQLSGIWHRHPANAPDDHERGGEGRRAVNLSEFLDEIEVVLSEKNLP